MPLKNLTTPIRKKGQVIKGYGGPVWQGTSYRYDPAEGTYVKEDKWGGSDKAISALSSQLAASRRVHNAETNEGNGTLIMRTPVSEFSNEVEVRYELVSEFIEKDLFAHPTVSATALAYDSGLTDIELTWRGEVEKAVQNGYDSGDFDATFSKTVRLLRNGITGYERENLVLRRYRKAPGNNAQGWQASILDGKYIYSTEQLGLPSELAFQLPNIADQNLFPISIVDDQDNPEVVWGWRRRPTTNVWTREYIEQSSEFVLAEWSLLLYEQASGEAGW